MEIDDLKEIWRGSNESAGFPSIEEIRNMIGKKSSITINRVKRDLKRKAFIFLLLGITVLASVVKTFFFEESKLHLWDSLSQDQFSLLVGLMGLVVLSVSFNMLYIVVRIEKDQKRSSSLRQSISGIVNSIRQMMNISVYSDAIGVPLFSSCFIYIQLFKNQPLQPDWRIIFLPAISIFLFWIVRKRMRIYQKNKYGSYIDSLEQNLIKLKEVEEN